MHANLDSDNTLDHENNSQLRSEAFRYVNYHSSEILRITMALEELDHATQRAIATGLTDDRQSLVSAAGRLASLIESGVAQ